MVTGFILISQDLGSGSLVYNMYLLNNSLVNQADGRHVRIQTIYIYIVSLVSELTRFTHKRCFVLLCGRKP